LSGFSEAQKGILYCALAHLVWGGMALYFGLLRHVSPAEIAVHRGLWSIPIAAAVLWKLGLFPDVLRAMRSPRAMLILAFTSFLIVFNWGFYVWSIEAGRTLESSLGYYINPLFNVVAGFLFLGERFTRVQTVALAIAAAGVAVQTIAAGVFPWLGLMLGATFCLYGFIRKTVDVGPAPGFFIEVLIIAVPALFVEAWLFDAGEAKFLGTAPDTLLLMGCGAMTSAALLLFAASLKRIRYSTAGLMQYISPTLVFLTAVFVFGEPMDGWKLLSFALVWLALGIFTVSALTADRARRPAAEEEPATL
jgi:chloramphenicol-sensitive protein RarD